MTVSYDELFENNQNTAALTLWKNGNLVSEESYVIFKMALTSQFDYTSSQGYSDASMEFVIDLPTYIQALVLYLPDQLEDFCDACQENEETCLAQLYSGYGYNGMYGNGYQQGQAYQMSAEGNDGGRRKLSDVMNHDNSRRTEQGQVVRQLDCEMCVQYSCIQPQNANGNGQNYNNNQYGFQAAAEWLANVAQCYETGIQYSNANGYYAQNGQQNQMYAGFMCNDEGNGVEIGLFLDELCELYLVNEPYSKYMSYYDSSYQEMTKDIIEFTFSGAKFDCKDDDVVYTTNDVSGYQNYYNYQNNNNGNQAGEAAEWCSYLYENEMGSEPVPMSTCGGSR